MIISEEEEEEEKKKNNFVIPLHNHLNQCHHSHQKMILIQKMIHLIHHLNNNHQINLWIIHK